MRNIHQHRTVKSPCCNKKTHITFQYGALIIGAFCDCGKHFYLRFRKARAHRKGYRGYRAGRLIVKATTNGYVKIIRKKRKTKRKKTKQKK